ncbi:glycosyltransferase 87 family protein [Anaerotruncus colihominis]|nr:glycosyltransferase 87 family protein [Anaerotruncus colihominis]MCR2024631.1 glycosyltransferase 87 family protein [Anaerotruncus colihominis]
MKQPINTGGLRLSKKDTHLLIGTLTLFALILRLMVAYTSVHYYDLSFYVDWSTGVTRDFYGAYNNIESLDYPPLFLFPLFLTGKLLSVDVFTIFEPYRMLALKGWQLLFDTACVPLFYTVLRRWGVLASIAGAALWAVNPTALLNSAYWGQTDAIMIFLVVVAFALLEQRRAVWSGVVMTLACLMKFQSLYFAPVYALVLLTAYPPRKSLQTIAAGLGTAAAVFLPFMARSGFALPARIYFGGFEKYAGTSLNAFNLYGALGLNYQSIDTELIGGVTAGLISVIASVLACALLVYLFFTATTRSLWLLGFVFMQTVFLFSARMHERYQIPVLAMALAACFCHKSRKLFTGFAALTVMTFLNHFFVIEEMFTADKSLAWIAHYDLIVIILSWVNLLLYIWTLAISIRIFYKHGKKPFLQTLRAGLPYFGSSRPLPGQGSP